MQHCPHCGERLARRTTASTIASRVALVYGVKMKDMLSRSRLHHLVVARAALYRALLAQDWTYPAIAKFVGRHHTTIISALWPENVARAKRVRAKFRECTK